MVQMLKNPPQLLKITSSAAFRCVQAENSVLFNALPSSLALSVDDIVEAAYPQAEISVLALPLQAAQHFVKELLIEARDASAWCKRSASSSASSRGPCVACRREAAGPSEQPQGRERPRPPTRRASPGAMPHRKAAEEVISLSSCGGSNRHHREGGRRENESLGSFFSGSDSLRPAAAAVRERAPEAGAPQGTPLRGRRARSLAGWEIEQKSP